MVAVIDYNAVNTRSVMNALSRLGVKAELTSDIDVIKSSDRMIFPGVGAASWAMDGLKKRELIEIIKEYQRPFLGICLGMQLMCQHSEEGNADCLGIFPTAVKRFQPMRHEDKVPHMGWNTLTNVQSALFEGGLEGQFVYFVHSYYVPLNDFTAATTDYILPFSASLHKDNFYATQFHPEKSGSVGEQILKNFLQL